MNLRPATSDDAPAMSRIRSVRAAPAVLVVLAIFTWINGYRASLEAIAEWELRGGSGQIAPGLYLAALGIALQAAGTRLQWIDNGPPFTDVPPSAAPSRFYNVNEIITP